MKGILLSAAAGLLLFAFSTACLRYFTPSNRVRALGLLFLVVLLLLVVIHLSTPPDLGFLGKEALISGEYFDLFFALGLFTAGFFGGILQIYNLADRGLSLRMLIDILEDRSGALSTDEMMVRYGHNQGIVWMYDKRIRDMKFSGLIVESNENLVLTERGAFLARAYSALRTVAHVEEPDPIS